MNILVGCEFSGIVRDAFRAKDHNAVSCDLEDSERKGPHYKGDILDILDEGWDLLIAFPPCTHLAISGARWFKEKEKEQKEALEFVRKLLNANIPKIALENPVGVISSKIRKPDQIIQPYQFGHRERKKTCLWLKGLPLLKPTKEMYLVRESVFYAGESSRRQKDRSRTFTGIAQAMAEQWG